MLLEIACFNKESCLIAQEAGADRIEFCADYDSGGITPTLSEISELRKIIHIPLFVMIRPRKGNFVYSYEEIESMKTDIRFCKQNKIDGVVFAALTETNEIDEVNCKALLALAKPLQCTFHRAIDSTSDRNKSIERLIELGFDTVLTSGCLSNAQEGIETLRQLQVNYGKKITIMPGGGIRPNNIQQIKNVTGCMTFHSAALSLNSKTVDASIVRDLLLTINS